MRKVLLLMVCALSLLLVHAQTRKQKKAKEKADKEIVDNLLANIQYLASDSLEGRRTGTYGEILAADYIAKQFNKNGLVPKGTDGYLQPFDIDEGWQYNDSDNSLMVDSIKLLLNKSYFPLSYSATGNVEENASINLREKGEIWFYDVKDVLNANKKNPHFDINSAVIKEASADAAKGAAALLVYNSSAKLVDNIQFNKYDTSHLNIPVVFITKDAMHKYFKDVTGTYNVALNVALHHTKRHAINVVGFINFNAATTVVIGAHFDHLGYGEDGNSLDGQGQIHNGADDNASGTAALIELSRMLQNTKAHNNNYVFIAFSGEELGLLGSKYWLDHPSLNVSTNYMINMDMIGRYDSSRKLTIGGYGTSPVWKDVFDAMNDTSVTIKFDSSGSGPSDHASFYHKNIPVLFFFTNAHEDYHKATDDWDKINYNGEMKIVDYIERIIETTDNKGKLAFTKTADNEMHVTSLPVTLGVMPDYAFTGTGLRIDAVSKGKLAEQSGLLAGDVLLQLGDYTFVDVQTYMQALQHFKKGDATTLRFKRGTEEKIINIVF